MLLLLFALNSFAFYPQEVDYADPEYLTEDEQIIEWQFTPKCELCGAEVIYDKSVIEENQLDGNDIESEI